MLFRETSGPPWTYCYISGLSNLLANNGLSTKTGWVLPTALSTNANEWKSLESSSVAPSFPVWCHSKALLVSSDSQTKCSDSCSNSRFKSEGKARKKSSISAQRQPCEKQSLNSTSWDSILLLYGKWKVDSFIFQLWWAHLSLFWLALFSFFIEGIFRWAHKRSS